MRVLTLLGATGSIGGNTLDIMRQHPHHYRLFAATANKNVVRMLAICKEFQPEVAVMVSTAAAIELREQCRQIGVTTEILSGTFALQQVASATEVNTVMAAIVGAAGLLPALAAVKQGKRVLLANKEALVMSGQLFMDAVATHQAQLLPIDSEHNALFQCLPRQQFDKLSDIGVIRLHLTASGGPLRQIPLRELPHVSVGQACAHPNWVMGQKISVDSATMMNKGLEVIEACWLFHAMSQEIEVLIHPQSIIHSMVEYADGSFLAQMGHPDMRTPIAHAMAWPRRIASGVDRLDFLKLAALQFEAVDKARFPCLDLARQALAAGGGSATVLNAANEVAVKAFLDKKIGFTDIARYIESTLSGLVAGQVNDLEGVLAQDARARSYAETLIAKH